MYAQMKSQIILAGSGGCMRELAWQMPDWQISGYVLWGNNAYTFTGADEASCKRGHEIL